VAESNTYTALVVLSGKINEIRDMKERAETAYDLGELHELMRCYLIATDYLYNTREFIDEASFLALHGKEREGMDIGKAQELYTRANEEMNVTLRRALALTGELDTRWHGESEGLQR
jgi:hypothetical protein